MIYKKLFQQMTNLGLIFFFLVGCGDRVAATPTTTPVPLTLTATPQPTATITPTITPSPTFTSVPVPPMPTFEILGEYEDPIVEITNQQGVKTTVKVRSIDSGDFIVNYESSMFEFPLTIADGVYVLVDWNHFRRAYPSTGGYTVTLADGQELEGKMDFALLDKDGKRYELNSMSTMILTGLSKTWLPFLDQTPKPPGPRWQLHILLPEDLTFTVAHPDFAFEYQSRTLDVQTGIVSIRKEEGTTEFFSLKLGGDSHKLSSQQETRFEKGGVLTIKGNDQETSGGFFPILNFKGKIYKGATPSWYLRVIWVDHALYVLVKNPVWILTKQTN